MEFGDEDIRIDQLCMRDRRSYRLRLTHLPSGASVLGREIGPDEDTEETSKRESARLLDLLAKKVAPED